MNEGSIPNTEDSEVPSLAEAYPDDYVHAKPLPAEDQRDNSQCHNCGEPWNDGTNWDTRHLHGGPSLGETWKYECPSCGHETFEVGI